MEIRVCCLFTYPQPTPLYCLPGVSIVKRSTRNTLETADATV